MELIRDKHMTRHRASKIHDLANTESHDGRFSWTRLTAGKCGRFSEASDKVKDIARDQDPTLGSDTGAGYVAVTVEQVMAYWDRQPCNIRHSKLPVGTKEYFDEVEAKKYFVEPHIPGFVQFERWAGKRVLEVGCGIGTDAINFARAGADYTAVELSKTSLALTRKRFQVFGLRGNFYDCNAERLSELLDSNSFDLVYSFGVIHHTPAQRAVIEEIRKVIRQDGELRIMLYAKNSWKHILIEAGLDQPEAQNGCPIATAYSPKMVEQLLAGLFQIVWTEQTHIFPYVIEKYVRSEYEVHSWFKAMPPQMFKALERRLGWHYLIFARPI